MTLEEKKQFWQKHVDQWRESGISQKAYCLEHTLKLATFGYWRKRLSDCEGNTSSSKLVPVRVAYPSPPVVVEVDGLRLHVPIQALSEVLSAVHLYRQAP